MAYISEAPTTQELFTKPIIVCQDFFLQLAVTRKYMSSGDELSTIKKDYDIANTICAVCLIRLTV